MEFQYLQYWLCCVPKIVSVMNRKQLVGYIAVTTVNAHSLSHKLWFSLNKCFQQRLIHFYHQYRIRIRGVNMKCRILKKWLQMNEYFDCPSQSTTFPHLSEFLKIPYWRNKSCLIPIEIFLQFLAIFNFK